VFFAERALAFAVKVQDVPKILGEVPDCVDGDLDAEVCGVGVGDGNLQDVFTASIELTQECFAVEKPGVWEWGLGLLAHGVMVGISRGAHELYEIYLL
jgi:hypothetical protein